MGDRGLREVRCWQHLHDHPWCQRRPRGVILNREKHPGSFEIVHLKDKRGVVFATRSDNVFAIGEGVKPWISLPRGKGIKLSIQEAKEKLESKSGKGKKE